MSRFKVGMLVQVGKVQRTLVRPVPDVERTWVMDQPVNGFTTVSEDEMRPAKVSTGRTPVLTDRERRAIKNAK